MLLTLQQLGTQSYSLVVIGAGPAGIIVALEYARRCPQARVLLVEYGAGGAPEKNQLDDTVRVLNPVNHHEPYECTNKGLGGTSQTWGGRCVMYDRGDFIPRPVIGDHCTWDESFFDECLPHVGATQSYFESGQGRFELRDRDASGERVKPLAEGFKSDLVTDRMLERWSLPTRFGVRYREAMENQANLEVVQGAELLPMTKDSKEGWIKEITLGEVGGALSKNVTTEAVVLAMGAQETTRWLLRSPAVFSQLAAVPDALGKYYQGHVSGKIATICFNGEPKATEYGFRREADGTYQRRRFQFTKQAMVDRNLLNTAFWLDNPLYFDPGHHSGPMSFMYLAMVTPILGKKLAPPSVAYSITKGRVNRVGAHIVNIIKGLPGSLWTPFSIFVRRYCVKRQLPGVFLYSANNRYALHFHAEQRPAAENQMRLGDDGQTLVIDYRVTAEDAEEVVRGHELLDAELRACGSGYLDYWFPPERRVAAIQEMSKDGVHQSGTTRIGDSPEKGVVDRDLRVWGTKNLYVCSSSAFPTSGQANPTFFLGTCAIRLAHHLSKHAHR